MNLNKTSRDTNERKGKKMRKPKTTAQAARDLARLKKKYPKILKRIDRAMDKFEKPLFKDPDYVSIRKV